MRILFAPFRLAWAGVRYFLVAANLVSAKVDKKTEEQYTGSEDGIHEAYRAKRENLSTRWRNVNNSKRALLIQVKEKEGRIEDLEKNEQDLRQNLIPGATKKYLAAEKSGNATEMARWKGSGESYVARQKTIDGEQNDLATAIETLRKQLQPLTLLAEKLERELKLLPDEEQAAVRELVQDRELSQLELQLKGIMNPADDANDPVEAVRRRTKERRIGNAAVLEGLGQSADSTDDEARKAMSDDTESEFLKLVHGKTDAPALSATPEAAPHGNS